MSFHFQILDRFSKTKHKFFNTKLKRISYKKKERKSSEERKAQQCIIEK